jgi:hypothetical protein
MHVVCRYIYICICCIYIYVAIHALLSINAGVQVMTIVLIRPFALYAALNCLLLSLITKSVTSVLITIM